MFLRPQSVLSDPQDIEALADGSLGTVEPATDIARAQPIIALLDGMPVQAHSLLVNRLIVDDPDNLEARSLVSQRLHGTAMASLILHGDRNDAGPLLPRPLYVRPLMLINAQGVEQTDNDRLLVDTIHRAVLRIKGTDTEEAAAPAVFLINLSLGDVRRPFAGVISPLARLLDFLADKYGLLFLVSGGNVQHPLEIAGYTSWTAFERASPEDREKAVIRSLDNMKHERTILSPAEALNVVTVPDADPLRSSR
jgi:hypothetical protein